MGGTSLKFGVGSDRASSEGSVNDYSPPDADSWSRVQILVEKFTSSIGLAFQKLLPKSIIEEVLLVEEKQKDV